MRPKPEPTRVQWAARILVALCVPASAFANSRRDRLVSLILAGLLVVGVAGVLSIYRGYDWRGRRMSGGRPGGPSVVTVGLAAVLAGLVIFVGLEAATTPSSRSSARSADLSRVPGFALGTIPRSLGAGAPTTGSTPGEYASYLDRLCAAAAPYERRLGLDVAMLGRGSLQVAGTVVLARVRTATVYDELGAVVGEEGQLLAVERPSRRAPAPSSAGAWADLLGLAFTRLVGLEQRLSSRYHRIALGWFDRQVPITHRPAVSIAAGTAAAAGPAATVLRLERALGAGGCAAVPPPVG